MLCIWIYDSYVERCRTLGFEAKKDDKGRWCIISHDDPVNPDSGVYGVPAEAIEEIVFGHRIKNVALQTGCHNIPGALIRVFAETKPATGKSVLVWARSVQAAAEVFLRAYCNRWPIETYRFEPDTSS